MHNDSTRISANEINRYVYCNYQWYYRRYYGDKTLTGLRKEHNQALGIQGDPRTHAFVRGTRFHNTYHRWYQFKRFLHISLMVGIMVLVLFFVWKGFW